MVLYVLCFGLMLLELYPLAQPSLTARGPTSCLFHAGVWPSSPWLGEEVMATETERGHPESDGPRYLRQLLRFLQCPS